MSLREYASHFAEFKWPWYMPSVGEYSTVMEGSGLHDARVWGENADRFFPDSEAISKWMAQPSLVPFLAHVPDRDKTSFREYVIKRMIEGTRQDDGRCFETFRRINVSAHK